ncbi:MULTISPECIES: hypothetical protein [unclassified Tenacibaculum]|uniref:hypothetical protein n=1 Tax=unclassified Tenacibaculum TaxID=2635139 RepID=UPI001F2AF2D6|nr:MULTISPECIES: hypothetical protein [unclassified Tenacibaculum]MCF2875428.1 hypothetical protein [Tenacibaculum sp. Cn5-1]MCF2935504.1 hypothetical protein [Tenacibaculum sp. Cn5-34]MCG7512064.1 hypothetical protein [Tenacibaculum sp. Cn5-46]
MGNPLAIPVAASVVNSKEGQKAIGQGVNALKVVFLVLGVAAGLRYVNIQYKKLRANNFARENAGNPNLTAAAIIYESFTRIGFPDSSFLSMLIPSINISTDEAALNDIATRVSNVKAVSHAYYILFDRNLFTDIRKGLGTDEIKTFWGIINSSSQNENVSTLYPIGITLYCADKNGITVNKAEKDNGVWKGTDEYYDQLKFGEKVGKVIANGVFTHSDNRKENYYIVEDYFFAIPFTKTGVVLQHQVTNKEI